MRPADDEMDRDGDVGRVIDVLSSMTSEDAVRDEPPADLWASISARMSTADQPKVLAAAPDLQVLPDAHEPEPIADSHDAELPTAVDLDARRRQRWARVAAAAAVVVLAAGTFGVINANNGGSSYELVASVDLEPLQQQGSGTAELVTLDGVEQLRITADGLPPAPDGHHYEMWLIDAGVTDPRSLGSLPSGQDQIVVDIPEGVDPGDFPIVDINLQVDGEEQHSGVDTSVLRGSLA
jgi:hypothetical protein